MYLQVANTIRKTYIIAPYLQLILYTTLSCVSFFVMSHMVSAVSNNCRALKDKKAGNDK